MSSPKIPSHDPLDNFIGRCLKYWLWHQEPPLDSKEKLLQTASRYSIDSPKKLNLRHLLIRSALQLQDKFSSLAFERKPPSPGFIDTQLVEPSMPRVMTTRQVIFRSFPTRMEFLCLIN